MASKFSEFSLNLSVFVLLVVNISYFVEFDPFSFKWGGHIVRTVRWPDTSADI